MISKKTLAILSLLIVPIYLPIILILAAIVTLISRWKKDINDILPNFNKLPKIFSNFKEAFPNSKLSKSSILYENKKSFLEEFFEEPEWWFFYFSRSRIVPENIQVTDMRKISNDEIEIYFIIQTTYWKLWDSDPETWEKPHLTCRETFNGIILCKDIEKIYDESEPTGEWARLKISKSICWKYKELTIIGSKTKKSIAKISCNKLYLKKDILS